MDRPDIPLNALRVFEVALRQGSFTGAAIELRVTQAAVSHQIARLEDRLGTTLFRRTSRGLVPTDEALTLFPILERGFDNMARALDRLSGKRHIEVLKIGVVTTFALKWLMPRVSAFQNIHPDIDLRISTHNNRVEILREGLDMAIRFGDGAWAGINAEPLLDAPLAPFCAPSLFQDLRHPNDLGQQILLRSFRSDEWPRWFAKADAPCPSLTGPIFDTTIALAELAADGAGVALLPAVLFERQIAEGKLIQAFSTTVPAGRYYLTSPKDHPRTPAMDDFASWMRAECTPASARPQLSME